jgi:predicted ribosomally synthesized peptide with nif11-like leader
MSTEQVQALLQLAETADFRAKFEAALPEERRNILARAGLNLSLAEAEAALAGERELADAELDQIAGGDAGVIRIPPPPPPPPGG